MIIVKERHRIEFSHAGVKQHHDCQIDQEDNLMPSTLRITYFSGKIPSLEGLKTVDQVVEKIKTVSYCGRAEVVSINGMPLSYYYNQKNRDYMDGVKDRIDGVMKAEASLFFKNVLKPMLIENMWHISESHIGMPVVIGKDEEGMWESLSTRNNEKYKEFEYLCDRFLGVINDSDNHSAFSPLLKYIDFDLYKDYHIDSDKLFED